MQAKERKAHFQQIADEVATQFGNSLGGEKVTEEQVCKIATGVEVTISHPVIDAIRNELRKRKLL